MVHRALHSDHPALKSSIREMAMERARRFKIPLTRVTLTVEQQRRRVSLSLDDEEAIATIDPDMADAVRLLRLNKTGTDDADDAVVPFPIRRTSFRQSGTDAVLASNVIVSDGTAARIKMNSVDRGSNSASNSVGSVVDIRAVEKRLDTKLNGVNERLDGLTRLVESLVAAKSGASQRGSQP
eukprot:COSAG02_NODE_1863_length_10608_cov_128.518508_4_plen_182_part_00